MASENEQQAPVVSEAPPLRPWLLGTLASGLGGAALLTAPWWLPCRSMGYQGMFVLAGVVTILTSIVLAAVLRHADGPDVGLLGRLLRCVLAAVAAFTVWMFLVDGMLGALDRGFQKRTMSDMRALAEAIEAHAAKAGAYPVVDGTADDLMRVLPPPVRPLAIMDDWKHPFHVESSAASYMIISYGCCSEPDVAEPSHYAFGATHHFSDDIVYSDIGWVRYPDGVQE